MVPDGLSDTVAVTCPRFDQQPRVSCAEEGLDGRRLARVYDEEEPKKCSHMGKRGSSVGHQP